ncbi:integrase core domain-containing protein [Planctomycetes bacterium CA13]|uniref:integrase core domain-containing protein n=1 Tax=Novipirellula herctigrandis TaxID=2527986 RepID=UPI0011B38D96
MNAHLERFFGSLKSECLYKLILFCETATRKSVRGFLIHYHTERNHQGAGNELIVPLKYPPDVSAKIETTERRGVASAKACEVVVAEAGSAIPQMICTVGAGLLSRWKSYIESLKSVAYNALDRQSVSS